jgi:hypothetical protein
MIRTLSITVLISLSSVLFCSSIVRSDNVLIATFSEPLDLQCQDLPLSANISWYFNHSKTAIPATDKKFEIINENNTLRIKSVDPTVVAHYGCSESSANAENAMGFDILVKAFAVQPDKGRNVIQGDPLNLECKAWGFPLPTVEWQFNGTTLVQGGFGGRVQLKNNTGASGSNSFKFPIIENASLRIENIDYEQEGNYTCVVSNLLEDQQYEANATTAVTVKDKYAALWPFLGICVEVAVLCTIILIYEKRRAKRIEEEERQEEAAHLNANNDTKTTGSDDVRQRK